jgi:membrane-bound lytic murein transglycosylase D
MKPYSKLLIVALSLVVSSCSILKKNDAKEVTDITIIEQPSSSYSDNNSEYQEPEKNIEKTITTYEQLFPRIIDGFQLQQIDHKLVSRHKQWYLKNATYIARVLERSEPYLYFIVEEIEKRQLPMELALLPVIESAYRTEALSRSKASGLWQFIPSTGRYFGLKQNWWSDQRRDVVLSTQSALDYLKELNKEFNGDWHLAIAAYNGGRGTIASAIKKNKRKNLPTDFFSLKLSRETSNYVPKLLALSHAIKNAQLYNIKVPYIENTPYFTAVATKGQIDMPKLISETSINDKLFYQLNAGFKRWASSPEGPHRLIVPQSSAQKVINYIASQPARPKIQWRRHKLKNGDTLYDLSRKYKVSVAAIKTINRMKNSRLRAGKTILIPLRAGRSA